SRALWRDRQCRHEEIIAFVRQATKRNNRNRTRRCECKRPLEPVGCIEGLFTKKRGHLLVWAKYERAGSDKRSGGGVEREADHALLAVRIRHRDTCGDRLTYFGPNDPGANQSGCRYPGLTHEYAIIPGTDNRDSGWSGGTGVRLHASISDRRCGASA